MGNQTAPLAASPPPAPPPPHGFAASPDLCARAVAVRRRYQLAGRWCGGVVPYGYRATPSGLVIHPAESATVAWIFTYIVTHSSSHVAHALNTRDVRSPRGKLGGWSAAGVQWIARNRVYLGCDGGAATAAAGGPAPTPGNHEAIVSHAAFAAAAAALSKRVRRHRLASGHGAEGGNHG